MSFVCYFLALSIIFFPLIVFRPGVKNKLPSEINLVCKHFVTKKYQQGVLYIFMEADNFKFLKLSAFKLASKIKRYIIFFFGIYSYFCISDSEIQCNYFFDKLFIIALDFWTFVRIEVEFSGNQNSSHLFYLLGKIDCR